MIISYKERVIDFDKPVYLYRNLHKKGRVFSLRQNNKVVAHVSSLFILKNCEFIIKEGERQRALREKQRNVHAFVKGYIDIDIALEFSYILKYDIEKGKFYCEHYQDLKTAKYVYIDNENIKVIP